ncbi:MAG TPA: pitrilysin family protein [Acidimicrobiales bacterium]|nr:pitrilysin family protein [Acidimicrobiales bacterium]
MPRSVLAPSFAIERHTLGNGMKVVVAPDRSAPVVAVAVHYDVGYRSEPEGRTGFAHLFEHLMFEGSENLPKLEHAKLVQGNGGQFNGSTTPDFTNYFEVVPTGAFELMLFLEADRMRSPVITDHTVANQIDVVKEEIRLNIMNRPYGGMQSIHLPTIAFTTFNNAHNGYGSFVDLEAASVADATDFWKRYYAPGNALLTIAGDVDPQQAIALAEKHFGDVPKRAVPKRVDFAEPVPTSERRGTYYDPMSPTPAMVVGYRTPDPISELADYAAYYLLVQVLAEGDSARLYKRLVKTGLVTAMAGFVGPFDNWLDMRNPVLANVIAIYPPGGDADTLLAAIDESIADVQSDLEADELDRCRVGATSRYLRATDSVMNRALTIAPLEQQRGRAELINEIPAALAQVSVAEVQAAASSWFAPNQRAVLDWQPGEAK